MKIFHFFRKKCIFLYRYSHLVLKPMHWISNQSYLGCHLESQPSVHTILSNILLTTSSTHSTASSTVIRLARNRKNKFEKNPLTFRINPWKIENIGYIIITVTTAACRMCAIPVPFPMCR